MIYYTVRNSKKLHGNMKEVSKNYRLQARVSRKIPSGGNGKKTEN